MAVQESAAQLSMTLKVQEYPTLKVGAEPPPRLPPARRRGAKPLASRPEQRYYGGEEGSASRAPQSPFLPAPRLTAAPGAAGGTAGTGFPPLRRPPVPVFSRLTSRLMPPPLRGFPSPSAEGEGRAWNMLLSPGASVP